MNNTQSPQNFLRPQSFGFDIFYGDYLVARAVAKMKFGYNGYDIIVPGGVLIARVSNSYDIGPVSKRLINEGRICTGDFDSCNCAACLEEAYAEQQSEIDAENAWLRHAENAGWEETLAEENRYR
jgi:hypothetical protein